VARLRHWLFLAASRVAAQRRVGGLSVVRASGRIARRKKSDGINHTNVLRLSFATFGCLGKLDAVVEHTLLRKRVQTWMI
jgi:hypothetical protein